MILSWFTGVPQNGTIAGSSVNFTDFGRPEQGIFTPPSTATVQRRTSIESGTRTGSRQSL